MTGHERRDLLRAAGSLLASATLAGCGSSSRTHLPGDTQTINGLAFTFVSWRTTRVIRVVAEGWADQAGETADEPETQTPTSSGTRTPVPSTTPKQTPADASAPDDPTPPVTTDVQAERREFLVVVLRIENVGEVPKSTPMPAPAPVFADGRIFLNAQRAVTVVNPSRFPHGLLVNAEVVHSLTGKLGAGRAELDPGESVTGWMLFDIIEGFEPTRVTLNVRANPEGSNEPLTWRFAE